MRRSSAVLLVLCSLAFASTSTAAERFASVSGAGSACSAAAPCSLPDAMQGSASGDVVTIAPGTYNLTQNLSGYDIRVRGTDPTNRPVLDFQLAPSGGSGANLGLSGFHAAVQNLVLRNLNREFGIFLDVGGDLENVTASGVTTQAICSFITNMDGTTGTIQNVNCYQHGSGAAGDARWIANGGLDIRSSTFASSTGTALAFRSFAPATARIDLRNTLVAGPLSCQSGVIVHSSHNLFAPLPPCNGERVAEGGDITLSQPLVLFTRNDYGAGVSESVGTVDAGTPAGAAPNGIDVDGDARTYGAAPDIGDDERTVAPTAQTGAATGVTGSGATAAGSAATGGARSTWFFEYGPTAAYGSQTAAAPLGGQNAAVPVSAALTGYPAGTLVHYRLVVTNRWGRSDGEDRSFTTSVPDAPPPPAPPSGGPTPSPPAGGPNGPSSAAATIAKVSLTTGTIGFATSRAGRVTVLVERRTTGRQRNGRCSASARRGRTCTAFVRVYRKTVSAIAGTNHISLPKPRLRRGTYRVTITPAGGKATKKTITVR
ncbi:hypothetical protein [Baekduia sp. Peel2402]|uniref:hypothetical protein n=1 Tax=Baekduia sp. Peel2402 TaxID=3458296 RepID=UPI00403E67C4